MELYQAPLKAEEMQYMIAAHSNPPQNHLKNSISISAEKSGRQLR